MTASPTPATPATSAGSPERRAARHASEPSLGELVAEASTQVSNLVHSEIALAKMELRASVKNAGVGVGLFLAAAVVAVFSLTFGFIALAEGLVAAGLWRWLAFLVVFGFQLLVAALLVLVAIRKVKRVKAPQRTITSTKETVDYLKKSRG